MASSLYRLVPVLAASIGLPLCTALFTGCETTGAASFGTLNPNHPELQARNARIAAETPGSYYIARRYWIPGTRFWGFVREPRQTWDQAKLVILNENKKRAPDRLPETSPSGPSHGYDHNYEYIFKGHYTGERIYDPNSNQILPEFMLDSYELVSSNPGFLFHPNEVFQKNRIPKPPVYRSSLAAQ